MTVTAEPGKIGSSFDSFLDDEGIRESVTEHAIKTVVARQLRQEMAQNRISKTEMAARMGTSRRQLDRLLDPAGGNVTLGTLMRAARAVGRELVVEFR